MVTKPTSEDKPDGFKGNDYGEKRNNKNRNKKSGINWTMATWNVRTMLKPGKMKEVADQIIKYNIDVTALQEMRWPGQGRLDKKEYSLIYSGPKTRTGLYGPGFIVNKRLRSAIIDYETFNSRLCKLRLKGKYRNLSLIAVHAPTEDKAEEEKDLFYDNLCQMFDRIPRYDTVIILGDFNAQVGKENYLMEVAGKFTLHDATNNNGQRLADFAISRNLKIKSTSFPHKLIHLGMWKAPDGRVNQIDHVLISSRHASSIIDVRACRGPNCDSDHFLVKALFRHRIANVRKGCRMARKMWNTDKLGDEEIRRRFENAIACKLEQSEVKEGKEEEWCSIKTVVQEAAERVLGERNKRRNVEWFDEECQHAIEKKNADRIKMIQRDTRNNKERYRVSRKEADKVCRKKKREWLRKKIVGMEEMRKNREERRFYQAVRRTRNGFKPKMSACRSKNGVLLSEGDQVMERWAEYYWETLNEKEESKMNTTIDGESRRDAEPVIPADAELDTRIVSDIEPPSFEDFEDALELLKNNRAPGEDNLTVEALKNSGEKLHKRLYNLILKVWFDEEMPSDWSSGLILPIFKKGDRSVCENYRGISLLNVVYKILSNLLLQKLKLFSEKILTDYQCGFRPGRGTTDQIFMLRQVLEKCYERNLDVHILFIDFKQAFDRVNRTQLFNALRLYNIPLKLINLIRMTMSSTHAKVFVNGQVSKSFQFNSGVRQGDALSAILFNLALHKAIRGIIPGSTLASRTNQILGYADDLAILGRNKNAIMEIMKILVPECSKVGLSINDQKTKYMVVSNSEVRRKPDVFRYETHIFEAVEEFKYLGVQITSDNMTSVEIKSRIMAGNRAYYSLLSLLKSSLLARNTKLKLYRTLIRPVACYGAETWTLKKVDQQALGAFERKILRKIFGPICNQGEWRIRTNMELEELMERETIIRFVKSRKISWLGHLERLQEDNALKKILKEDFPGKRRRGRPRKNWKADVECDLAAMGVSGWRERLQNRDEWRRIVWEAKVHPGL